MKLFGVLLTVLVLLGAMVGGVVGVLLPKISSGLALGFLISLYLGVVRLLPSPFLCPLRALFPHPTPPARQMIYGGYGEYTASVVSNGVLFVLINAGAIALTQVSAPPPPVGTHTPCSSVPVT